MNRHLFLLAILGVALAALACGATEHDPRNLSVIVGAGRDTVAITEFFPKDVTVRAGDTVTWTIDSDEIHTVSFMQQGAEIPSFAVPIPGGGPTDLMIPPQIGFPTRPPGGPVETWNGTGFASSGLFSEESPAPGVPANPTFALTFDTPGTYDYLCLIHPGSMLGSVEVVEATVDDVPSQADIDAVAAAELAVKTARIDTARQQAEAGPPGPPGSPPFHSEPAPGGGNFVFVKAGVTELVTADFNTQLLEFFPKDLTINAGDTVIWGSDYFHSITFVPTPPTPEFVTPEPQAQGPPILKLNPQVLLPAKPDAIFDPGQYFNSGPIGPFLPVNAFALTFDEPGTFEYVCAFHEPFGMEGTVTVLAR